MAIAFLTARWQNLFLATYAVPPALLVDHVPPGLELEMRDGNAFVSLVAFEFLDTRVLYIPWPGFRNFGEINLRFYVHHHAHGTKQRGVVFLREFVPQRFVAWLARTLYNEPYLAAPLTVTREESSERIRMDYRLHFGGREQKIEVIGRKPSITPTEESDEHFFKEHEWGFGVTRGKKTLRYQVTHPVWNIYPIESYALDFDFATVYGPQWALLQQAKPYSVILAVGSPIAVYPYGTRKTGS